MESPGEYLRRERELRRVPLVKIFEATRVSMKFLEAIEADRVEELPHPTFVKGFIRSYCKVLGLDETDAVLRFELYLKEKEVDAAAADSDRQAGASQARPANRRKPAAEPREPFRLPANLKKPAMVAAGILLILIAYAFSIRKDASMEALPPEPVAPANVEAPAQAVGQPPAEPDGAAAEPAAAETRAQSPGEPAAAHKPASAGAGRGAEKAVEPPAKAQPGKPEAAAEDRAVAGRKAHTLTAAATEMVWMKVGIDGGVPAEVLLREGERFTWRADESFSVIVGNAGGVTLTYDGRQIPGLGLPGEVVSLKFPPGTKHRIRKPDDKPEGAPGEELLNAPVLPAGSSGNA